MGQVSQRGAVHLRCPHPTKGLPRGRQPSEQSTGVSGAVHAPAGRMCKEFPSLDGQGSAETWGGRGGEYLSWGLGERRGRDCSVSRGALPCSSPAALRAVQPLAAACSAIHLPPHSWGAGGAPFRVLAFLTQLLMSLWARLRRWGEGRGPREGQVWGAKDDRGCDIITQFLSPCLAEVAHAISSLCWRPGELWP